MRRIVRSPGIVERTRNLCTASGKFVRRSTSKISSFLHRQPGVSIATGVAAGFVLALVLRPAK